ncbi:MAG: UDP-N-acetylglucosamine 2-epimerase [Bacteroidia bacterium]|nr:UDP-N-acetylglucosamine 2-epimerase [Bacteroidia bacterium]
MKKILYISGTRADYGLMRRTLKAIEASDHLELKVLATGMHLMESRGYTLNEIKADNFELIELPVIFEEDSRAAMAAFVGDSLRGMVDIFQAEKPDVILLLGDRGEMLAAASAALYLGIAVAHIHGGEVTSTVDEAVRHAITKLAQVHFPATEDSAKRILKMGESPKHVHVCGAPGLDGIDESLLSKEELFENLGFDVNKALCLLIQHPVSEEVELAASQIEASLEAILEKNLQTVIVYPNADAGGKSMIEVIQKIEGQAGIKTFSSLQRQRFLSLMKHASVMVGNSSAGIIEAPSFQTPVVNIGERQLGRLRGKNVIDVENGKKNILKGLEMALGGEDFQNQLRGSVNPYGDGKAGERIVGHLIDLKIDSDLLQKQIEY